MGLKKLNVEAYSDSGFSKKIDKPFEVMFNPEDCKESFNIVYNDKQAPGASAADPVFNKIAPKTMKFSLLFDGTGALIPATASKNTDVRDVSVVLDNLFDLLLYNGDIHRPNFCKLSWGSMIFKCVLVTVDVNYTHYDQDGVPIRAKVDLGFKEHLKKEERNARERKNSPDLTHYRIVKEGDSLPLMTYAIYGEISPFQKVALYNELHGFRNLEPGMRLVFPPLEELE